MREQTRARFSKSRARAPANDKDTSRSLFKPRTQHKRMYKTTVMKFACNAMAWMVGNPLASLELYISFSPSRRFLHILVTSAHSAGSLGAAVRTCTQLRDGQCCQAGCWAPCSTEAPRLSGFLDFGKRGQCLCFAAAFRSCHADCPLPGLGIEPDFSVRCLRP